MKRKVGWIGVIPATVIAALLLTPRPCAACSPVPPESERLSLTLVTVEVDGEVQTDLVDYEGLESTLRPAPSGPGLEWVVVGPSAELRVLFFR